jgi:hypothetical protein
VNLWHGGSLPGTTAILYRTASGLTWAALFNTRPNPPNDDFIVDIITQMGKAAFMNKAIWGSLFILVFLVGILTIFYVHRRKRKISNR